MKKAYISAISFVLILSLPAAGIILNGGYFSAYLTFPPAAGYVNHEPFSWTVFISLAGVIFLVLAHPLYHVIRKRAEIKIENVTYSFPWWGYAGVLTLSLSWVIAWTRLPLFHEVQRWTFLPLWLSYIIIVNALCVKRGVKSLLTCRGKYLLSLFPVSALFWWLFEYLNRYTANWFYSGVGELTPHRYLLEATLAFSIVLPAVMSTAELLKSFPRIYAGMDSYLKVSNRYPRFTAAVMLLSAATGLALTGIFPDRLFPLLWISPFIIIVSVQTIQGEETVISSISSGDWRGVVVYALSALLCGFFWEMWNIESLAKWIYSIPYVHGFKIFEMPLLGYAGYLPFGLECAVVAGLIAGRGDEPWRFETAGQKS